MRHSSSHIQTPFRLAGTLSNLGRAKETMDDRSAERPKCPPEPRRWSFRLFCLGMMSLLCCLTEGRWWGEDEALLLRFTSCAPPALFQPPSAEPGISPGCNANAKLSIITSFNGYLWCRGKIYYKLHEQAISKVREHVKFTQRY